MTKLFFVIFLAVSSAIGMAGEEHRVVRMKVTSYCCCEKCCGDNAIGYTSTGKLAKGTQGVAADPKLLPYGTVLEIPGIGKLPVDDTGGAMRQDAKKGIYHIDIRAADHETAKKFGVKWLEVKVLPKDSKRAADK